MPAAESKRRTLSKLFGLLILGLAIKLTAMSPVSAQGQDPSDIPFLNRRDPRIKSWNDYGGLVIQLHKRGYRFVTNPARLEPRKGLVIILGRKPNEHYTIISPSTLRENVLMGCRLLLASDRRDMNSFSRRFGIGYWPEVVEVDTRVESSVRAYKGFKDCPVIPVPRMSSHPILEGVNEIVLNRPISIYTERYRPLLTYPVGTTSTAPFMVAGDVEQGRLVCLADHSPFINSMLTQLDNRELLLNILDWLEDKREIDQVLVICDGVVHGPPKSAAMPKIDNPVQMANILLSRLQRSPAWNRMLYNFLNDKLLPIYYAIHPIEVLAVGGFLLALLTVLRRRSTPEHLQLQASEGSPSFLALRSHEKPKSKVSNDNTQVLCQRFYQELEQGLGLSPSTTDLKPRLKALEQALNQRFGRSARATLRQVDKLRLRSEKKQGLTLKHFEKLRQHMLTLLSHF